MAEAAELPAGSIDEICETLQRWCARPGRGMARVAWDSAIAREQVLQRLRANLTAAGTAFHELELPSGVSSDKVAHGLLEQLEGLARGVVSITGIEWAYPEGGQLNDTLGALGFLREPLAAVPVRQIWWMPERITGQFVTAVPDFESWFRLRLRLSEVPAFESGPGQTVLTTAEASRLADQMVERIRVAESHGIPPDRVWAELGRPLILLLQQGGLDREVWLARIAGFRRELERHLSELMSSQRSGDPDTLAVMRELAGLAREQNDLHRARELAEQMVTARIVASGETSRETLRAKLLLAAVLLDQGEMAEAERLARHVEQTAENALGKDALTFWAENFLANVLKARGALAEARQLYDRALAISRAIHGENSPTSLGIQTNLANTLLSQGDLEAARRLYEGILAAQSEGLGNEHPDTILSQANLARTLHLEGRLEEARELGQAALDASRRVLAPRHTFTNQRATNLIETLVALGRREEARLVFSRDLAWLLEKDPESLSRTDAGCRRDLEELLPKLNLP